MEDDIRESSAHSQTAEAAAAARASHYLYGERPLVLEDPYAIDLIGQKWLESCHAGGGEFGRRPICCIVIVRARYTEDQIEAAVRSGVDQYVILGAGLDTFALRRPDLLETIKVYEIDKPATQEWKRERLSQIVDELPAALEFVPADLEHETVAEALSRSSFRSDRRALFSWLGSTMYLSRKTVFRTLQSIASASAPGSEIIFEYFVPDEFITEPDDISGAHGVYERAAQMGEPHISWFNPLILPDEVRAVGFEVIESLSPKQMEERYFAGRNDGMGVMTHCYYIYLRSFGG